MLKVRNGLSRRCGCFPNVNSSNNITAGWLRRLLHHRQSWIMMGRMRQWLKDCQRRNSRV